MKTLKKLQSVLFIVLMAAFIAVFSGISVYAIASVLMVGTLLLAKGFDATGVLGEFIVIKDDDAPEVKKGKEDLNKAFTLVDEKGQKALGELKGLFDAEAKGLRDKSAALEGKLAEIGTQIETAEKTQGDKIKQLTDDLTEMARTKAKADDNKRKGLRDNIIEQLEGKEADFQKYTANKGAGLTYDMKAVSSMGVITNSVPADYTPLQGLPHETRHARQYMGVSPTNSNLIRYLRFTAKEGALAPVLPGGQKPKKDYNQAVIDAPVIKLAGLVDVYDEFFDDVDGSRAWLADELVKSLYDLEDAQIFKGNGTTGNLSGLYTNATALGFPYATVTAASNNLDKFAAAITYVMRRLRNANAGWTSPEDILAMWINKSTGATQVYSYPLQMDSQTGLITIMGVPIIPHTVFNPGEGFVGDFAMGARLYQKLGLVLSFSQENNNNFETNTTTARIEERVALANFYPESFVKVALNGASS